MHNRPEPVPRPALFRPTLSRPPAGTIFFSPIFKDDSELVACREQAIPHLEP